MDQGAADLGKGGGRFLQIEVTKRRSKRMQSDFPCNRAGHESHPSENRLGGSKKKVGTKKKKSRRPKLIAGLRGMRL